MPLWWFRTRQAFLMDGDFKKIGVYDHDEFLKAAADAVAAEEAAAAAAAATAADAQPASQAKRLPPFITKALLQW